MNNVRKEIMATLIKDYRECQEAGGDGWKYLESMYPGIPIDVVAEVALINEGHDTEEWWKAIETTIDSDVVKSALRKGRPT